MMQAVQYRNYSSDFQDLSVVSVPRPVPVEDQVLVKVFCAAGNAVDMYLYHGKSESAPCREAQSLEPHALEPIMNRHAKK